MNKLAAIALIRHHEHCRLDVYADSLGNLTAGWGHLTPHLNLGYRITQAQADEWLQQDADEVFQALARLPWVNALCGARQAVMADMAYNLGVAGMSQFKQMIARLSARDWLGAATEMMDSKWARQVKRRATEDAVIIVTAQMPDWYSAWAG